MSDSYIVALLNEFYFICLFNVQPQFEDYTHMCTGLHNCMWCMYSNSIVRLLIGR